MTKAKKKPMHVLAEMYAYQYEWNIFPIRECDGEEWDDTRQAMTPRKEKAPYNAQGLNGAKRKRAAIDAWWGRSFPGAMIGLPTGRENDIWVLDVDIPSDVHKEDGRIWLAAAQAEHGPLPETRTCRTANGGLHYYWQYSEGVMNGAGKLSNLPDGIDVRGQGGYVIAAGSIASDGRFYEWTCDDETDIAVAPDWLLEIVRKKVAPRQETRQATPYVAQSGNEPYARAALEQEIDALSSVGQGGRGFALNQSAFKLGSLVKSGALERYEVEAALYDASCSNGLVNADGDKEVRNKIRRGMDSAPVRHPPEATVARSNTKLKDLSKMIARAEAKAKLTEDEAATYQEEPEPEEEDESPIKATPFKFIADKDMPRREFAFGTHYIRKYASVTVSPGGIGKTSNAICEGLSMTSGLNLLGIEPKAPMNVWIFNAEDPIDELNRRVMAAVKYYALRPEDYEGRLFIDSGRDQEMIIAKEDRKLGTVIQEPIVEAVVEQILRNKIDVMIVDPFVSTHRVNENDNGAIDEVAKLWSKIADYTNCAIDIVHHLRKVSDRDATVEDARGAVSLIGAARSVRVFNLITAENANKYGLKGEDRFSTFGITTGKANLAKRDDRVQYRRLESQGLGNGAPPRAAQDFAPVVTEFVPPDAEAVTSILSEKQLTAVLVKLRNGNHQVNSAGVGWAGHMIGEIIGVDTSKKSEGEAQIKGLLDALGAEKKIAKVLEKVPGKSSPQWFWTTPDVAEKKRNEANKGEDDD